MTKYAAIKQLDSIIGKLGKLQFNIDGANDLSDAISSIAYTRDKVMSGAATMKKFGKRKAAI